MARISNDASRGLLFLALVVALVLLAGWLIFGVGGRIGDWTAGYLAGLISLVAVAIWLGRK